MHNALYDLPAVLALTSFLLLYVWRQEPAAAEAEAKPNEAPYDKPVVVTVMGLMAGFVSWRLFSWKVMGAPALLRGSRDTWIIVGFTAALAVYMLWRNRDSLATGDTVRHKKWGEGIVTGIRSAEEVVVRFPEQGEKTLHVRYAPIEKV